MSDHRVSHDRNSFADSADFHTQDTISPPSKRAVSRTESQEPMNPQPVDHSATQPPYHVNAAGSTPAAAHAAAPTAAHAPYIPYAQAPSYAQSAYHTGDPHYQTVSGQHSAQHTAHDPSTFHGAQGFAAGGDFSRGTFPQGQANPYAPPASNYDLGNVHNPDHNEQVVDDARTMQSHRQGSVRSFLGRTASRIRHSTDSHRSHPVEEEEKHVDPVNHLLDSIAEENDSKDDLQMDVATAAAELAPPSDDKKSASRGYRENLKRHKTIQKYTSGSKVVKGMRKIYTDILSRTLITRMFIWWLPLALILFIPLAVDAFGSRQLDVGHTRVMWLFIWLEVAWASLAVGRLLAHYLPEVFGVIITVVYPRWFRFIDALVALELPVTLVIWAFVSFITFIPLLSDNHRALKEADGIQNWQRIVNNILVALLVSSLVFLCEQIFIHLLSTNYHRTRMSLRIKHSKKSIQVLTLLLELAYSFFPQGCSEFGEDDALLASTTMASAHTAREKLAKFGKNNKFIGNMSKALGETTNMLGALTRDFQRPVAASKIVKTALALKSTRIILAGRIWKSLVMEDSDSLTYEDMLNTIGHDRKEEVLYIFDLLDTDGSDGISLEEMTKSVNAIGKETKSISRSLQDIDGAITKLNKLLLFVCLLIVIIIFVGMLAPSVGTVLATLGSTMLALSFIFAATAQEVLASCVFLFVKHPMDVGDVVYIDVPSLNVRRMVVTELSLLYTTFRDDTSMVIRQVSNSILNTLFIDNASRSPPMTTSGTLQLGLPDTTGADIDALKDRINDFLNENPRDYLPGVFYQVMAYPDLDRINIFYLVTLRNNLEDSNTFFQRQGRFLQFLGRTVYELGLTVPRREDPSHQDPALPFYMVHMDGKESKEHGRRRPMGFSGSDEVTLTDSPVLSPTSPTTPTTGTASHPPPTEIRTARGRTGSMVSRSTSVASNPTGLRRTNTRRAYEPPSPAGPAPQSARPA